MRDFSACVLEGEKAGEEIWICGAYAVMGMLGDEEKRGFCERKGGVAEIFWVGLGRRGRRRS